MRLAQELNGNIAPLFPGSSPAFVTYTRYATRQCAIKAGKKVGNGGYCIICTMLQCMHVTMLHYLSQPHDIL